MNFSSIKEIIDALKNARRTKNLSQSELAIKLGIPQSHLSRIESNKVNPSLKSTIDIARMLDFELMLIPKKHYKSVEHLIKAMQHPMKAIGPKYTLSDDDE